MGVTPPNGQRVASNWFLHHGHGGGGPVTKGVIQAQRDQASLSGADVVVSGHIHEAWYVEHMTHGLNRAGNEEIRTVRHVCVPGYKDEYDVTQARLEGWHVQKGRRAKPLGAWFVRLGLAANHGGYFLVTRFERLD